MGRPRKPEGTNPVRLPESLAKKIRRIATHRDIDPGDYIAERFLPLVLKDEAEMLREIEKERGRGAE